MDCGTPAGFPVHHYLPKLAQSHVHWVGDAIQSPVICLSCRQSFLASGPFPKSELFAKRPKYWSFSFSISPSNEYSGLISFRMDWFDLLAVHGTLKSPPAPQFKSISSSVLSLLYGPTLTSICDYWKKIIALTIQTFVGKVISLLFNTLSRFVIAFLWSSKYRLISWLQWFWSPRK